jgi:hypothetical protein
MSEKGEEKTVLRIEPDEPTDQVIAKLTAIPSSSSSSSSSNAITEIRLGHQDYVLNDDENDEIILKTIQDVVIRTFPNRNWKRLVFEYSYFVAADNAKEQRRYESSNATFRKRLSVLGRRLQRELDLDQNDLGLEGDSNRADVARVGGGMGTEITGHGSIVFKKVRTIL